MKSEIQHKIDFSFIRYSVVWEDVDLLYHALSIGPEDDILSVTSAGCNVLGLLLKQPRSVTAIDINFTQNALLELKIAGIKLLEYEEFISFIGIRPCVNRLKKYQLLRKELSTVARDYWDSNLTLIESGIVFIGKLEKYFKTWQEEYLSRIHPPEKIAYLLSLTDLQEQRYFFEKEWATPAFIENFKWYFGNYNLQKGRDRALFKYVETDAGTHFYKRFQYVCTQIPLAGNYYLEFFLTSAYQNLNTLHPYLQAANYELLRSQLDKVQLVNSDLETFLTSSGYKRFSKANLSNIFEYMSEENAHRLLELLHDNFRKGGLLAYWNLLVPRSRPDCLKHKFLSRSNTGSALWQTDRSWFYRDFIVEEVV